MRRLNRRSVLVLAGSSLIVAGCGAPGRKAGAQADAGPPRRGGTATLLQMTEPRTLDPAILTNAYAGNSVVGNALYGYLFTIKAATGEVSYGLAENLATSDGGTSWTLTLRQGLTFSDGSPFDAAAVKFNWERIKDPTLGSSTSQFAGFLRTTTVTDPRTLTFTLAMPISTFGNSISESSMNWIASPAALQKGQQAFDAAPVGAGPFVLQSWTRQDRMTLARNPSWYDKDGPYLDAITLRTTVDENQRLSTLISGGGDLMIGSNAQAQAKATTAGLVVVPWKQQGSNVLLFNARVAPFNDPRARDAVAKAIDINAVNQAVFAGKGEPPTTLFYPDSPLFEDIPLSTYDKAGAQALFDQLAAEGKPVGFTMTSYPTNESRVAVEAMQAQLSGYAGVKAQIEVLDFAGAQGKLNQRQFQAAIGGSIFNDPGFTLWNALSSTGKFNYTGTSDAALDAALDAGRTTTDLAARKVAYRTVQERLRDIHPFLMYMRNAACTISAKNVHGVEMYGNGSLRPERLWIESGT